MRLKLQAAEFLIFEPNECLSFNLRFFQNTDVYTNTHYGLQELAARLVYFTHTHTKIKNPIVCANPHEKGLGHVCSHFKSAVLAFQYCAVRAKSLLLLLLSRGKMTKKSPKLPEYIRILAVLNESNVLHHAIPLSAVCVI